MAIVNALAGIMVSDLTAAEAWYEQLLSLPADARPMEGLAEWKLADGGWIQVFQDRLGCRIVLGHIPGVRSG